MTVKSSLRIFAFYLILATGYAVSASTIGIATGNKTLDGRPLLFKTKDRADNYPSDVDTYAGTDQHFAYVFQENFGESHLRARMGINSSGFGVVYTTSENLQGAGSGHSGAELAAMALKTCASIQDFRNLLSMTENNRDVHEHYGIIDSCGVGSLFEVDGYTHIEIPITDSIGTMANTAKYHPNAGPPSSGSTSPQREARVAYLLEHGPQNGLDYHYFINEIMKDYCTTQADEDKMPVGQYETNAVISRYKTAAGCVIRGCKTKDDPKVESALWLTLGEPSLSIALPFFPACAEIYSNIKAASVGDGMAGSIDRMRQQVYDYSNGRYADRFVDSDILVGIRKKTFVLQDSMTRSYESQLPVWRSMTDIERQDAMQNWSLQMQEFGKSEYDSLYSKLTGLPNGKLAYTKGHTYFLFQNYPNPFNPLTHIKYELPFSGFVRLSVYNTAGKKVKTLVHKIQTAGRKTLIFNAANLASGIYYCKLQVAAFVQIRKMVLLQ